MIRCSALALGTLGIWYAVDRWLWYQTLPIYASARICGNCFSAFVGVPFALGLLGLLLVTAALSILRLRRRDRVYWCCAVAGILLTPHLIGVPLFAFGFLALLRSTATDLFKWVASIQVRP